VIYRRPETGFVPSLPPLAYVPDGFIRLVEPLAAGVDRQLGYAGEARFVLFYYEPRGDEVTWNDGRTYGFGLGGWRVFLEMIEPLAQRYEMNVGGTGKAGPHVLIIDRLGHQAFFAERRRAQEFLTEQSSGGVNSPAKGRNADAAE